MWSVAVYGVFLLAGFSLAQNPYVLKRPSYCSTCFTNDQRQNYYCCFYFFRCCAESRLSSNNRQITTPSPQYPGFDTTQQPLTTENQDTGESTKLGTASPHGADRQDTNVLSGEEGQETRVVVSQTSPDMGPDSVINSRRRNGDRFGDSSVERTPSTSYSSGYGGRRYPYNVPRQYPVRQPSRNTEWRETASRNGGVRGRSRTGYSETSRKNADSAKDDVQQTGEAGEVKFLGDVFWGRMEPVEENINET